MISQKRHMKRTAIIIILLFSLSWSMQAQETYAYAERDTTMHLDIYRPNSGNGYTIIHIFGGGFVGGYRTKQWDADYCRQLTRDGYTAVAIDYRLGLRGVKNVGLKTIEALERAIYMAVEDCSDAVAYLVNNAERLQIDPKKIIIEGSSAGAITALMTDYARCNALPCAESLPAYSGAIFSRQGKPQWVNAKPAPTLIFHGTVDKIVPYKKIQLGKTGLFGGSGIAENMDKQNLAYQLFRYKNLGHEVAIGGPLTTDVLNLFVKQYITEQRHLHIDVTIRDDAYPPSKFSSMTLKDIYKNK